MVSFYKLRERLNAVLFISAMYFILWGILVLAFPYRFSSIIIESTTTSFVFWDLVAIITLALGIALAIAAFDPYKNWLILLTNLLIHLGMIIGFFVGYVNGIFSNQYLPFLFFNHVIWIIPLIVGLYSVNKRAYFSDNVLIETFSRAYYPLELFETTSGENLAELSEKKPVFLVFLRHLGCPFCQETLQHLSEKRSEIESRGFRLLLVYMSDATTAQHFLSHYNLQDVDQISDPESIAYKSFKLQRGRFNQLLGVKVLYRWLWLAIVKKVFYQGKHGDIYQMPGLFILHRGEIVKQFIHQSSADIPDYAQLLDYKY